MRSNTTAQFNRNLSSKKVDNFYVSFLDFPENYENILGREVKSIDRPTISFNNSEIAHKGVMSYKNTRIVFDAISVTFFDDSRGLINNLIYRQILRQSMNGENNHRFNVRIEVYSEEDKLVEFYELKGCFFKSVSHSQQIYDSSTNNEITVDIQYETITFDNDDLAINEYEESLLA